MVLLRGVSVNFLGALGNTGYLGGVLPKNDGEKSAFAWNVCFHNDSCGLRRGICHCFFPIYV